MFDVIHDCAVNEGVLVASISLKPVNDGWDGNTDVLRVKLEVWVAVHVTALVKVGDIYKVPVGLPAATLVLDHVGEGSCLNEDMISFTVGDVLVLHDLEKGLCLLKGLRGLLKEDVIGHSCN